MPLANLAVIMAPGLVLAVVSRLRPGIISPRATAWALATFAVWGPGMDRGFAHYEDYRLTPRTILGSTLPGQWVLEALSRYVDISNANFHHEMA